MKIRGVNKKHNNKMKTQFNQITLQNPKLT